MEELKKKYKKRLAFRDYRIEELQKQNALLEAENRKLKEMVPKNLLANATQNGQQVKSDKENVTIQKESVIQKAQQQDIKETTKSKCFTSTVQQQQPVPSIERNPKFEDANVLRRHFLPVWQRLWDSEPQCLIFRFPVDPVALNLPDYHNIVKNPMDLTTIKMNLDQGKYKNPWEFCDDIWLMFDNARLFNSKNRKVLNLCTKMSVIFIDAINPVMRRMGYCCGQKRTFTPLMQYCFGIVKNQEACVIARNQPYFLYERFIYCTKCFKAMPEKGINMAEESADPPNWIAKSKKEHI